MGKNSFAKWRNLRGTNTLAYSALNNTDKKILWRKRKHASLIFPNGIDKILSKNVKHASLICPDSIGNFFLRIREHASFICPDSIDKKFFEEY
jgi:hypothetical protein